VPAYSLGAYSLARIHLPYSQVNATGELAASGLTDKAAIMTGGRKIELLSLPLS